MDEGDVRQGVSPPRALANAASGLDSELAGMVSGIFSDRESVARAIDELIEAHFDPDHDLRVIVTQGERRKEVPVAFHSGASMGSAVGGVIGGVLGAVAGVLMATGRIPGPTSVTELVPWFAGIEGAVAGGASGYLIGIVAGLGFWSYRVTFDPSTLDAGEIRVCVRAQGTRSAEARSIMERAGALPFQNG